MTSVLYTHYLSSSLHLPLRVRVDAFQVPAAAAVRRLEEHEHVSFMMQLQVFQDGCPCHPIPVECVQGGGAARGRALTRPCRQDVARAPAVGQPHGAVARVARVARAVLGAGPVRDPGA